MKVFGPLRVGTRTLNVNRRGPLVWPTTSRVVRLEPERLLAFRITENHTVWSYFLEPTETGTRVTERREAPGGTTKVSDTAVRLVLGGTRNFEAELEAGHGVHPGEDQGRGREFCSYREVMTPRARTTRALAGLALSAALATTACSTTTESDASPRPAPRIADIPGNDTGTDVRGRRERRPERRRLLTGHGARSSVGRGPGAGRHRDLRRAPRPLHRDPARW